MNGKYLSEIEIEHDNVKINAYKHTSYMYVCVCVHSNKFIVYTVITFSVGVLIRTLQIYDTRKHQSSE